MPRRPRLKTIRRSPKASFYLLLVLMIFTAVFRPSYTHPPEHYRVLTERVQWSTTPGRANRHNEQIFIAIALHDLTGERARGLWAENLHALIHMLGPNNTFLSIYENNSGPESVAALHSLGNRATCATELIYEDMNMLDFPTVTLPNGNQQIKRVMYLSEVRNRSLRPLDRPDSKVYDKVLFLNDVFFDPIDAAQLLFSTNIQLDGKTSYAVACALDFYKDSIKMYDVYATRDLEGYSMGIPFFPFFSHAGKAQSRNDVLSQTDAVRVKSCWSGMAAFDAKYIQTRTHERPTGETGGDQVVRVRTQNLTQPARFRAEPESFVDACECCLLVADTIKRHKGTTDVGEDSGVYLNPYIRVGYAPSVHRWTHLSRRFERLFAWPQYLLNVLARMPTHNRHRNVLEGETIQEEEWKAGLDARGHGHWEIQERTALNGMYCRVQGMQVLLESKRTDEKNWENVRPPSGRRLL